MATKEIITWECDICGSEDIVSTHMLNVDGYCVEAEACDVCWDRVTLALLPFHKSGRIPQLTKVSRKRDVVPFPGVAWKFTAHALQRMGERHLDPVAVALAADEPETVLPGLDDSSELRIRRNIKVVVKPGTYTIITASKRDEEDDRVA